MKRFRFDKNTSSTCNQRNWKSLIGDDKFDINNSKSSVRMIRRLIRWNFSAYIFEGFWFFLIKNSEALCRIIKLVACVSNVKTIAFHYTQSASSPLCGNCRNKNAWIIVSIKQIRSVLTLIISVGWNRE